MFGLLTCILKLNVWRVGPDRSKVVEGVIPFSTGDNEPMHAVWTLVTAAGLLALFGVVEALVRSGAPAEATRRFAHIVGALAAAAFPLYLEEADVLVLGATFTFLLIWTDKRHLLRGIHGVRRPTLGAQTFPIGLAGGALIAWPHPAAVSFGALVLGFADTAAAVGGGENRRHGWRIPDGRKTVAGSLSFFAVAFVLAMAFGVAVGDPRIERALIVAAMLSVLEGIAPFGLDNLVLPPAAAILGVVVLGL